MNLRAVERSEIRGKGLVVLGEDNVPPVEIGLTELQKTGGGEAKAPPAPTCDRPESVICPFNQCGKRLLLSNALHTPNFCQCHVLDVII